MLFCAFVGIAQAQTYVKPVVSTATEVYEYYVMNSRDRDYFVTTTNGLNGGAQQLGSANAFTDLKAKVTFKLTADNKLYSTNTGTELILGYTTTNEAANSVQLFAADSQEGYTWKIESQNGGWFSLSAGSSDNSWNMHGGKGADIGLYRKTDGGSTWLFVPANEAAQAKADEAKVLYTPSADYYYQIKNKGRSNMLAADASYATAIATQSTADLNQLWAFEQGENGTFYLRNYGQGKYLSRNESDNNAWPVVDAADKKAFVVELSNFDANTYVIKEANGGNQGHAYAHDANWGPSYNYQQIVGWEAVADASQWYLEKTDIPVNVQEVTFTYSFKYNGVVKKTQTCTGLVGVAYPDVDMSVLPYGVAVNKPAGEVTAEIDGTTVDVEVIDNLPFVAAADYASIKNWYYIQMHTNPQYTKYIQAVEGFIEWADAEVNANEIDTYTWGFIGNPFDGFKLVNYGKGAEMGVNSTGSGYPAMGGIASATATAWTLKPSSTNPAAQYFCFQYPGSANYMNAQSGKIAFWDSADNGSTMWVTERDLSGATELQAVIDQVEPFVAAGVAEGSTVGYLTSESVANVATALAAAKEAVATKTGCIEAQVALQAAVNAVVTIQPEEGKFYTISSAMPNTDARSGQKMYVNNDGGMQFNSGNAIANVFQFVSDGNGKFFLKSVDRGTYMNSAKSHNGGQETAVAAETENAKAIAIANMGRANVVSLIPNGGAMMHAQAAGSSVVAWNNTDNAGASAWVIEEVNIENFAHTVTVGEAGWATLYLGYNATIPAGVTAYAVTDTEGWAILAEVSGTIPANEAVLIKAEANNYDFKFAETAEPVETNLLMGSVFDTNVAEAAYVLGNIDGEVGFYTATFNVSTDKTNDGPEDAPVVTYEAFKNNAFKAYLPKPAGSGANALRFNFGGTTAIESVLNGVDANAPIYDLSGRRVVNAVKGGIYIQNGKKFIVK